MPSIAASVPRVKPSLCPHCQGSCVQETPHGPQPCDLCDGQGAVSFRTRPAPAPPTAPVQVYTACVGADVIDTAADAPSLVRMLLEHWPAHSNEDVAVWSGTAGSGRCRLVAYLTERDGEPSALWL